MDYQKKLEKEIKRVKSMLESREKADQSAILLLDILKTITINETMISWTIESMSFYHAQTSNLKYGCNIIKGGEK